MKTFVLWPYYLPVLHAQGISLSPPRSEKQEVLCRNKEVPERLKLQFLLYFSQFSYSFMTNSLRPHGLQHTSPACPSPSPGACSNSCPLSWWCHPIISPLVVPFSSCLQSFPSSGSFRMSQFFALGGQSSFNISPSDELSGLISFRIDWFVSLQSKGPSKFFSTTKPDCMWHKQCLESWMNWATKFCLIHHIHLTSCQLTTTSSSISTTFCRENASTTSTMQKKLSKSLSNPEAWIFTLQE